MLPLAGRRILITRTRHQASELAERLEARGATTILIPTIELAPPLSFKGLDHALSHLAEYDWLVFTSANAVEAFHQRSALHVLPATDRVPTAVIGPATARAAEKVGLNVALIPPAAVAESLAQALVPLTKGSRVLLVRAAVARDHLPEALMTGGAHVTIAEAYRTLIPAVSIAALQELFADRTRHPHAITFTSSSTATNLLTLLEAALIALPATILRASIGPITTQTLIDLGLPPHLEAIEPTISSLAETLEGALTSRNAVPGDVD